MLPTIKTDALELNSYKKKTSKKELFEIHTKAYWDRYWKQRLEGSYSLSPLHLSYVNSINSILQKIPSNLNLKILIIGFVDTNWTKEIAKHHNVTLYDISKLALDFTKSSIKDPISFNQGCFPYTNLNKNYFDIVICHHILQDIPTSLHRLAMSELHSLLTKDGTAVVSLPLDLNSIDADKKALNLFSIEFTLLEKVSKRHFGSILCYDLLKAPVRFAKAYKQTSYRQLLIKKKSGFNKLWWRLNTHSFLGRLWNKVLPLTQIIWKRVVYNKHYVSILNKIGSLIPGELTPNHLVMYGKKKR